MDNLSGLQLKIFLNTVLSGGNGTYKESLQNSSNSLRPT